jgi:hypothetical protein
MLTMNRSQYMVNADSVIVDRLAEIQEEMTILLDEAEELLRPYDSITARAEAHWIAQIKSALGLEGPSACNLGDTIREIELLAEIEN